jgi:hypothetical protein
VADFVLSESPVARLRYFSVLGPELLAAGEAAYYRYTQPLYVEGNTVSKYVYQTFFVRFGGQSNLNVNTLAGGLVEYQRTDLFGDAFNLFGLENQAFNMLNAKAFYRHSSQRNAYFATKGKSFNAELSANANLAEGFFTYPYFIYKAQFVHDVPLAKKWAARYTLRSGNSLNRKLIAPNAFYSGGFGLDYHANIQPFFGYHRMELVSDGLHSMLAEVHYQFLTNHYLKLLGNVGIVTNGINFQKLEMETNQIDGFGAGYAFNSPIGPIQLLASHSTQLSGWRFYFYLGYWF